MVSGKLVLCPKWANMGVYMKAAKSIGILIAVMAIAGILMAGCSIDESSREPDPVPAEPLV